MKWNYVFLLLLAVLVFSGCAQPVTRPSLMPEKGVQVHDQSKTGHISQDEIWSGTIRVTGDIWLDDDITLTIMPGTTVLMAAGRDDQNRGVEVIEYYEGKLDPASTLEYGQSHVSLDVHPGGRVVARGTLDNPITFTSDSSSPNYADWEQIYLRSGSIFEYCIVEYGRGGIIADGDVIVAHSIFRTIFWVAVVTRGSPTVVDNDISDCGHAGIEAWGEGASPVISSNVIKHTRAGIGIGFKDGIFPTIENNTLIDNDIGIWLGSGGGGTIRNNLISAPNGAPQDWGPFQGFVYKARAPYGRYEEVLGLGIMSSSPTVTNNTISQLAGGIVVEGGSSPTIENNIVAQCYNGFVFHHYTSGLPELHENNIYGNKYSNIRQGEGGKGFIDTSNNWWGTTDIDEIEAKIHHYNDDPSLGKVNYQPIATAKIADAGPQAQ